MLNLNRANRNAIMSIFVLIALIFALGAMKSVSKYQPRPITIKAISEKSLFDLENKVECAAGYKDGSTYSMGLTPGGLCGARELVSDHANYEIEDGIGGSLI
jgi:hypothetical protein